MYRKLKTLKQLSALPLILKKDDPRYEARLATESSELLSAKMLHAEVYLRRGFITADQIVDGVLSPVHDPYQLEADYFIISRVGEVVATARQIRPQENRLDSLPLLKHLRLNTYGEMLVTLPNASFVEISGLAKRQGESTIAVLTLYRELWRYSRSVSHDHWIMACDEAVYKQLKFLFGNALKAIGPRSFYMGSHVIPATLEITTSSEQMFLGMMSAGPLMKPLKTALYHFFTRNEGENLNAPLPGGRLK
jgi:hypothetical protein